MLGGESKWGQAQAAQTERTWTWEVAEIRTRLPVNCVCVLFTDIDKKVLLFEYLKKDWEEEKDSPENLFGEHPCLIVDGHRWGRREVRFKGNLSFNVENLFSQSELEWWSVNWWCWPMMGQSSHRHYYATRGEWATLWAIFHSQVISFSWINNLVLPPSFVNAWTKLLIHFSMSISDLTMIGLISTAASKEPNGCSHISPHWHYTKFGKENKDNFFSN